MDFVIEAYVRNTYLDVTVDKITTDGEFLFVNYHFVFDMVFTSGRVSIDMDTTATAFVEAVVADVKTRMP